MEEEAKPFRQPQRRLNPHMQEMVRVGVVELLSANTNCTFKVNSQSLKPFVEYFFPETKRNSSSLIPLRLEKSYPGWT
ncbi:hypothetical protein CK203_030201 [Vitis vinifera]|uniref:Uncharacterized protein n=1 Tax=Vitis vinifera TaxID=29760 RepID=A0A438I5L0_VITVI|nr:hypothetical protein CK203_030201 [Vitis vinifera]